MKSIFAKLILLLLLIGGVGISLLLYDKTIRLFSMVFDFVGYNLFTVGVTFVISVLLAGRCFRILGIEIRTTNGLNEISLRQIFKLIIGGFISSYAIIGTIGAIVLFALMLFSKILGIQ